MLDTLLQLPLWIWFVALLIIVALAFLLARYFRVSKIKVNTGLVEIEAERKGDKPPVADATPAPSDVPMLKPAREFGGDTINQSGGVNQSGGTMSAGQDIVGRDKAGVLIQHAEHVELPAVPPTTRHGFIPFNTTDNYIERGIEEQVRQRLLSGNGIAAIVSVFAPGGVGKSELAKRVANEIGAQFDDVFLIDCNDKKPSELVAFMGFKLGLTFAAADEAQRRAELESFLAGHHSRRRARRQQASAL